MGHGAGVIRQVRRIPPERSLPEVALPQPRRVQVPVDRGLFASVVAGATDLVLSGVARVEVGDVVHLVEQADGDGQHGGPRCCFRLVTRVYRGVVTVLSGTGQCEGRHG